MAKFSNTRSRPLVTSPVATTGARLLTHEGGLGYERDAKSELFLLAVSNLVGEDTFYEKAGQRDQRFADLVAKVTKDDPEWVARLVPWLRHTVYLRSCPLVMAAEYVAAGGPNGRQVIASALDRADEPAEMLAYWHAAHGRNVPQPVKRGVADAVGHLYNERSALRYDGTAGVWRMGDVVDLVHPRPVAPWQAELFRYLLDRRHNRPDPRLGEALKVIRADRYLMGVPEAKRREVVRATAPDRIDIELLRAWNDAGWSWERLSGWLPGGMDAEAWEAVIPKMGYMALLRNLRNFDDAGISKATAEAVATKLADPAEVARSRQLPIRFLSAWLAVQATRSMTGLRWGPALETALQRSVANVPELPGRTLVLIDVSGSMQDNISGKSEAQRWQLASVFGFALALRNQADVYLYNTSGAQVDIKPGMSVLRLTEEVRPHVGGGTNTMGAIATTYQGHDRVIVLTDEQAHDAGRSLPDIPVLVTFNLGGYRAAHLESGGRGRFAFGGLTDACFTMLPLLEAGRHGQWPHMG